MTRSAARVMIGPGCGRPGGDHARPQIAPDQHRRGARPPRRLGQAAARARDPDADRAAHPAARAEPLRHRPRPARPAGRRPPPALPDRAHARRHLQRSRRPADGQPRQPLRAQRPARVHGPGARRAAARAEPAPHQPRAADAARVPACDDAQPARRRVDPVRGARLVQPRQERAGATVDDPARRGRSVGREPDADPAHAPRPERERRRAGDVRHRRHALVGRLADLRPRAGVRGCAALGRAWKAEDRRARAAAAGARGARRPDGCRRELLGRARAPALPLHARAQRRLRPPARASTPSSRTTSSTTRRGSSSQR